VRALPGRAGGPLAPAPSRWQRSIADLADAVPLDDERLLALVRTLDALGLVELAAGRARVTVNGRRFAQAREDERKRLFADRLKSRMPLANYVLSALQARSRIAKCA
jgi:hypothetical protein